MREEEVFRMELRDLRERDKRKRPRDILVSYPDPFPEWSDHLITIHSRKGFGYETRDIWRAEVTVWCMCSRAGSLLRSASKQRGQGELEGRLAGDKAADMLGGDQAGVAPPPSGLGVRLEAGDTDEEESEDWTVQLKTRQT